LDSFKSKITVLILAPILFVGCGLFAGQSLTTRPKGPDLEKPPRQEMTLTIPEKNLTLEDKSHFLKLIEETIPKLSLLDADSKKRIETLRKFSELLKRAKSEEELYKLVSGQYEQHEVENVLYTGYFKPLFKGSLKRSKNYVAPLYSLPKKGTSESRKELVTSGALKSNELIYLKDPFEAYLAEIQGSVGIILESGEIVHLGFAGSNNQKYESIGSELVSDGKLTKTEATIPGIKAYFDSHPGSMQEYIFRNPRQVFFRRSPGKTLGAAGVELLAERSVATDRSQYPIGTLMFTTVEIPKKQADGLWGTRKLSKFVIALDCGSAIKGPRRIDLFLGEGTDIGEVAGRLNSRGKLEVFNSDGSS
jgi:membrane-bound lytic murein transglycosylase A